MKNLIKSELFKLKYEKMIYLIILLLIASAAITTFAFGETSSTASDAVKSFSTGLPMLLAIMISSYVTTEFVYKTMKNLVVSGFSKTKIFFAKLFTSYILTLVLFIVSALSAIVFDFIHCGLGNFNFGSQLSSFGLQFLAMIIFTTIFFSIGMVVKSFKWTTTINVGFIMFENIAFLFLSQYVLHNSFILNFSLTQILSNLEALKITLVSIEAIGLYVCVCLLFVYSSLFVFKRTEVK